MMGTKTVARVHRQLKNFLVRAFNRAGLAALYLQLSLLSPPGAVSLGDCTVVICAASSAHVSERRKIRAESAGKTSDPQPTPQIPRGWRAVGRCAQQQQQRQRRAFGRIWIPPPCAVGPSCPLLPENCTQMLQSLLTYHMYAPCTSLQPERAPGARAHAPQCCASKRVVTQIFAALCTTRLRDESTQTVCGTGDGIGAQNTGQRRAQLSVAARRRLVNAVFKLLDQEDQGLALNGQPDEVSWKKYGKGKGPSSGAVSKLQAQDELIKRVGLKREFEGRKVEALRKSAKIWFVRHFTPVEGGGEGNQEVCFSDLRE